jgi:hypothetical protein
VNRQPGDITVQRACASFLKAFPGIPCADHFFIALSFNGAAQSKSDYVNVNDNQYAKAFLMACLCEGQCFCNLLEEFTALC